MTLLGITAVLLGHFTGRADNFTTASGCILGIISLALLILCGYHKHKESNSKPSPSQATQPPSSGTTDSSSSSSSTQDLVKHWKKFEESGQATSGSDHTSIDTVEEF